MKDGSNPQSLTPEIGEDMTTRLIVVIDDERTFTDESFNNAIYLRTESEAILWIAKWYSHNMDVPYGGEKVIEEIWFDHDLGENQGTGLAVAKFFRRMCQSLVSCPMPLPVEKVFVHSQNPVGAQAIYEELHGSLKHLGDYGMVTRLPYFPDCVNDRDFHKEYGRAVFLNLALNAGDFDYDYGSARNRVDEMLCRYGSIKVVLEKLREDV